MTKLTKEQIEKDFLEYKAKKKEIVDNDLPIKGHYFRKITRPIQRKALLAQRIIKGQKVTVIGNKNYSIPEGKTVTFVVSHIGKFDYEIVNEQIKEQFYVMASDYRNMHGNINETMMNWFGVTYVDELSKEDRIYTGKLNQKMLKDGYHTMILSEGTWNLSPNEIIMDTHFGAVDGVMENENSVILPVAVEQNGNDFVVNFGEFYDPNEIAKQISYECMCYKKYKDIDEEDELESELKFLIKSVTNTIMRDTLATLKMQIWTIFQGVEHRADIPDDYWENFIKDRVAEWPGYSMQEQIDSVVHTKEKREHAAVLKDLEAYYKMDPWYFLTTNERFANYLNTCKNIEEIEETLRKFRSELTDPEPIQKRLEKYKELKRTQK